MSPLGLNIMYCFTWWDTLSFTPEEVGDMESEWTMFKAFSGRWSKNLRVESVQRGNGEGLLVSHTEVLGNHLVTQEGKAGLSPGCAQLGRRTVEPDWAFCSPVGRALWGAHEILCSRGRVWTLMGTFIHITDQPLWSCRRGHWRFAELV